MHANLRIRTYRPGDEQGIVDVLNRVFPQGWGSVEDWTWKHRERASFDPETTLVVEDRGRIVGCWHAVIEELELGSARLKVGFEGDAAVLPGYRGGGVVLRVYDRINTILVDKGAVMRAGVATPDLADGFYAPMFGYLRAPIPVHTKVLDNRPLRDAVARLGKRIALGKEISLVIQFRLGDIPPFSLEVSNGVLSTEDGEARSADLVIEGNQGPVVSALRGSGRGGNRRDLLRALLTRRVRVKGWLRNAFALYRLFATMIRTRKSTANLAA